MLSRAAMPCCASLRRRSSKPLERRAIFPGWLCPVLLLTPQLAVTLVFFFWPAGQAVIQSLMREDAFGLTTQFVGLENFFALFADAAYLAAFGRTALFSIAVAVLALAPGLLFAAMADRIVRAAAAYRTVLLIPYAIAPAIAGVLWMFLFNPRIGLLAYELRRVGIDWNYFLNG